MSSAYLTTSVEEIIQRVTIGKLIALPTDTVYALALSLHAPKAQPILYALKHREQTKAFALYVNTIQDIERISGYPLSPMAQRLAQEFFPGGITLVLKHRNPLFIKETLGFRIINHDTIKQVIEYCGTLIGTSANLSGFPPALTGREVLKDFPHQDISIFDSHSLYGLESTVVGVDPLIIYREGLISRSSIEQVTQGKAKIFPKTCHSFTNHLKVYTVEDHSQLESFLKARPDFQGLICNKPHPRQFYPTLRKALQSKQPAIVFVYDAKTSSYPELLPYLSPYYVLDYSGTS
ncbi:L-threonylcarbamoyladenylate synthase [Candidatus Chlamydia sanziniae]|uniref:L-threonylcarbamoyladenylate synthase n=1 Tax=Candidatus Chlamydia sanziniae TaxID=1806891 RepID=A0A1A9HYL5_9CHLA|nr:L-threonylcarbamoyladenylate synthase [Candidatus Chlamydia sanziniae]ANH79016.1 TsaC protein [Candidatus Chlamydia sanziniae]